MSKIYTFFEINSYINTTPGVVHPIGELSPYCRTFAPDVRVDLSAGGKLYYFGGTDFGVGEVSFTNTALGLLRDRLQATILSGFGTVGTLLDRVIDVLDSTGSSPADANATWTVSAVGAELTNSGVDTYHYPDYVKVVCVPTAQPAQTFEFHLWLGDDAFREEFPLATLTVVPPLDVTLDLLNNFATAKQTITTRTLSGHMDRAQAFLVGQVITGIELVQLRIYNIANPNQYFDCPFFIGYNGKFGVTYQNLIDAVILFLDSLDGIGTGYDSEDWLGIVPQLNVVGSYYFVPTWDNIAIPAPNPLNAPLGYNSVGAAGQETWLYDNFWAGLFSQVDIDDKVNYVVSNFLSIGGYVMPDATNDGGTPLPFKSIFTDYMTFDIGGIGSSGMALNTQNAIQDLYQLLSLAAVHENTVTILPVDVQVENINGGRYLTVTDAINSAKWYVLTRESYLALIA